MLDLTSLLQDNSINVPDTIAYVGDLFAKGVFGGIGKDVWEKIKGRATSSTEKKAIDSFEQNSTDEKAKSKLELMVENWIENDPNFENELISILREVRPLEKESSVNITNSKNTVVRSNLNNNSGTIHVGDK